MKTKTKAGCVSIYILRKIQDLSNYRAQESGKEGSSFYRRQEGEKERERE